MRVVALGTPLMLLVVVVVALMALAGQAVVADKELLQKLCARDSAAEVTSIAQVQSLIATLESGAADIIKDCKEETKHSILDLKPIIETENICSLEGVQRVVKYYYAHVHKKMLKLVQDKEVRRTPSGIKKFFIAYGLQASRLCRENLMKQLAAATEANIPADDMRFVTEFIDEKSRNYQIMRGKKARLEDLMVLGDVSKPAFDGQAKKTDEQEQEERSAIVGTAVSAENKAKIDDVKRRCAEKFKPIYDQLIVPVVQLAYLGFNYTDPKWADSYRQFEDTADYEDWFKAVFVCDSTLRMKVVAVANSDGKPALLTEDEFDRAQQMGGSNSTEPSVAKRINYQQVVKIDAHTELLDSSDGHLIKLVKKYNPKAMNCGQLLQRLTNNLPALLETYVKTGKASFGLSDVSGETLQHPKAGGGFGASSDRWARMERRDKRLAKFTRVMVVAAYALGIATAVTLIMYLVHVIAPFFAIGCAVAFFIVLFADVYAEVKKADLGDD